MSARRFVRPSPQGAFAALQPPADDTRNIIEYLLLRDAAEPLDFAVLAAQLGRDIAAVGKQMFALNRTGALSIDLDAPDPARDLRGWSVQLHSSVRSLSEAIGPLVLSFDGLLLSHAGCATEQAEAWAAGLADEAMVTQIDWQFRDLRINLTFLPGTDLGIPGWLDLARSLLQRCGPLGHFSGLA